MMTIMIIEIITTIILLFRLTFRLALITSNVVSLRRQVNESVRVDLDGSNAYTVILIQDGVSNIIKINGGSDSVITITQSD